MLIYSYTCALVSLYNLPNAGKENDCEEETRQRDGNPDVRYHL